MQIQNFSGNHIIHHIRMVHERKRNHNCDSCGKSFTESGSLKIQIKAIHEGQKNYKCDYCGKACARSGDLKSHIKSHEGQRNYYKCDSIDSLKNIKDGSISDVICPWNPVRTIKMEIEPKFDQVGTLK